MKTPILPTALIFSVIVISRAQQEICDDGWLRFEDSIGNGVCILVRKEPEEWEVARKYCEERLGNLLALDNFGQLKYSKPSEERAIFIGEEVVQAYSIEEFWSGMYVHRGRLMWDDYGPQLVKRSKVSGSRFWRWGDGQPDPMAGKCGKATVVKRQTGDVTTYDYKKVLVNLTTCTIKLPFVCRKTPTKQVVKTAAFCPENWLGNQYIPHCYRIYKEPVAHEKAKVRCQEEGTDLAPSSTRFDRTFAETVYMFYLKNDKYFEVTNVGNIWVRDTNLTQACRALNTTLTERIEPVVTNTGCLQSLLFMCVKQTKYPRSGYIETESDYFDQQKLLEYQAFEPLPVYGVLDQNLQENEVIFLRTPSFILNSSDSYFQWNYDNNLLWRVQESSRVSAPYYVNITLPFDQNQPQRRRRGIDDAYASRSEIQKRQVGDFGLGEGTTLSATTPNFGDETPSPNEGEDIMHPNNYINIRDTIGYYTFGIYNTNPPKYLEREPQLVRYSEKYLYIYVASCDLLDNVIGPSSKQPNISIEDVNSFNLLQDDSYMRMLEEIVLIRVLNQHPDADLAYYSAKIESFENTTVKFRVFAAPYASSSELISEHTVYDAVHEHFKMNLPNAYFKLDTLNVRSTVMCPFIQTVKDGNNLTFSTIKIGETGFSWERCYPGKQK